MALRPPPPKSRHRSTMQTSRTREAHWTFCRTLVRRSDLDRSLTREYGLTLNSERRQTERRTAETRDRQPPIGVEADKRNRFNCVTFLGLPSPGRQRWSRREIKNRERKSAKGESEKNKRRLQAIKNKSVVVRYFFFFIMVLRERRQKCGGEKQRHAVRFRILSNRVLLAMHIPAAGGTVADIVIIVEATISCSFVNKTHYGRWRIEKNFKFLYIFNGFDVFLYVSRIVRRFSNRRTLLKYACGCERVLRNTYIFRSTCMFSTSWDSVKKIYKKFKKTDDSKTKTKRFIEEKNIVFDAKRFQWTVNAI